MGLNVAVGSETQKLDKQIKNATKLGIDYVLFIGEAELKSQQFKLKNLRTGQEEAHGLQRLVSIVKDHRKN
jgi:histidyl-tRNA synthetase